VHVVEQAGRFVRDTGVLEEGDEHRFMQLLVHQPQIRPRVLLVGNGEQDLVVEHKVAGERIQVEQRERVEHLGTVGRLR